MKTTLSIAIALALTSVSVNATQVAPMIGGKFVETVPEHEYDDSILHLRVHYDENGYTYTAYCGAGVIGGKWLVTAEHCLDDSNGTVTLTQSHDRNNYDKQSFHNVTHHTTRNPQRYAERLEYLKEYYKHYTPTDDTYGKPVYRRHEEQITDDYIQEVLALPSDTVIGSKLHGETDHRGSRVDNWTDFAILELESPITHKNSSSIGFLRDNDFNETIVKGSEFTFQGWGQDSDRRTPRYIQQGDFKFYRSDLQAHYFRDRCDEEFVTNCDITYEPTFSLQNKGDNLMSVLPGDSGTPLKRDHTFYGVASYVSLGSSVKTADSNFFEFGPHKDFILDTINTVVTPNLPVIDVPATGFGETIHYNIQNLTHNDATLNLVETGTIIADGNARIEHSCGNTLSSFEQCLVDIEVLSAQDGYFNYDGEHSFVVAEINGEAKTVTLDIPASDVTPIVEGDTITKDGMDVTFQNINSNVEMVITDNDMVFQFYLSNVINMNDVNVSQQMGGIYDANGTMLNTCEINPVNNDLAQCNIAISEVTQSDSTLTFKLGDQEVTIVETTSSFTTDPGTDGNANSGSNGGSGGGSFGIFGLFALGLLGLFRKK